MSRILATDDAGRPLVFDSLGFTFHLAALEPADEPRLEAALRLIASAFDGELRWSAGSVITGVRPFASSDLDWVSGFAAGVLSPSLGLQPSQVGDVLLRLDAAPLRDFGMAFHGGERRSDASPYNLRFYATSLPPADGADKVEVRAVLHASMPRTVDLRRFRELARAVAGELRLRWGVAGLTFGEWMFGNYRATFDALFRLARRYPGYDVPLYEAQHLAALWHDNVRTVSWLTFLSDALMERVNGSAPTDLTIVSDHLDGMTVIQAGSEPQSGDVNRGAIPSSYAEVDALVRGVRLKHGVHFGAPWSARTTTNWLRRFERRWS